MVGRLSDTCPGGQILRIIVQPLLRPLVLAVPERVQCQMGRDPKEPCGKFRRGLIGSSRTVHAQKNLLRQFLGHRMILHHAIEKVNHGRAMFIQQNIEARSVSVFHTEHQLGVVIQSRCRCPHIPVNPFVHPRFRFTGYLLPPAYSPFSERSMRRWMASRGAIPECSI